jgi:CBS domain-containing protein
MKRVREVMTSEVTTLRRNDELSLAEDIMRLGRIRHMPVMDDDTGELVGILSARDLFQNALVQALGIGRTGHRKILKTMRVKEAMASHVHTIEPDAPLAEAARRMLERKLGCLPVVEAGKLVGIITESDFVALAAESD